MKKNIVNRYNIKRIFVTILLIIIGFVMQTTLIQQIQIADVTPNLVLILVVFISYVNDVYFGIVTGMVFGFLVDCQYGAVIGVCMFAYLLIGYFCGILNRVRYRGDYLIPLGMIVVSEVVYSVTIYAMDFLLRGRLNVKFYLGRVIIPEIVYTVVLAILLYGLISRLYENKKERGGNTL